MTLELVVLVNDGSGELKGLDQVPQRMLIGYFLEGQLFLVEPSVSHDSELCPLERAPAF